MRKLIGLFAVLSGCLLFGGSAAASDVTIQDAAFTLHNGAVQASDATASDGTAGHMANNSTGWNIQYISMDFDDFEPGQLYDVYARVKVTHAVGSPSGSAFKTGVWDATYGYWLLGERQVSAAETQNGFWQEYKLGTFTVNARVNELVFYVAGTDNAAQVADIAVDSFVFKPNVPQDIDSGSFNLLYDAVGTADGYAPDNHAAVLYNNSASPQWAVQAPIDSSRLDSSKTYDIVAYVLPIRSDMANSSGDVIGTAVYNDTDGTYAVAPQVHSTTNAGFNLIYQFYTPLKLNASPLTLDEAKSYRVAFFKVNNGAEFPSVRIDRVIVREADPDDALAQSITAMPYKISPANGDGLYDQSYIHYTLASQTTVHVEILDSSAAVVRTLVNGVSQSGSQTAVWDGRDGSGSLVGNGMYTARVRAGTTVLFAANIKVVTGLTLTPANPSPVTLFPRGVLMEGMEVPWDSTAADTYLHRSFDQISDANANFVHVLNMVKNTEKVLDIADLYGLKVIGFNDPYELFANAALDGDEQALYDKLYAKMAPLLNKPALFGYELYDEPPDDPQLARKLNSYKLVMESIDPDRPVMVNQVMADSAETHFELQRTKVLYSDPYGATIRYHPDPSGPAVTIPTGEFLAISSQPFIHYKPYLDFLHMLSKKKLDDQVPLWTILQNFAQTPYFREPTPEEVRAMTYLALGHGSKGISYFLFQSENQWTGMVDYDHVPTAKYYLVQDLLGEIADMEDTLSTMKRIGNVAETSGGGNTTSTPNTVYPNADVTTHLDPATGDKLLVVVNHDVLAAANVTITIDRGKLGMAITGITDERSGAPVAFTTTATSYTISGLPFAAGDGAVLRLVKDTSQVVYEGQDAEFTLYNGAVKQQADASATDGETAVKVVQGYNGWDMQWYWDSSNLDPGATYDLYAVVKIKYADDVKRNDTYPWFPDFFTPTGDAFYYGAYDFTTAAYPTAISTMSAADMEDMLWHTVKIGSFIPSQTTMQGAFIYPANNPENVYAVYVDSYYFVKQ